MTFSLSHRFLRLYIGVACVILIVAALKGELPQVTSDQPSLRAIEPASAEFLSNRHPSDPPQVLVGLSPLGVPTPTPTATPWPEWVESLGPTTLWSRADPAANALLQLPQGYRLKVAGARENRLQVYFGGDGEEPGPPEGWVDLAAVVPAGAPKWVRVRDVVEVRLGPAPGESDSTPLPAGAILEVLEDRGRELRVFYLGDGRTGSSSEGWVKAATVRDGGGMLSAEKRGIRTLTRSEVSSLGSGEGVWLKIPYRSQLDGGPSESANCGPASVGMVLEHFRSFVSTRELRGVADRLQGTSDPEGGFAIEYLEGLVEQYGLKGEDLYAGEDLRRWNLELLRAHIRQGHPVIPQLRFRLMPGRSDSESWDDHYVVISGMHGEDFIYNDSIDAEGPGYARLISAEALVRAWGGSYFPFAAFAVSRS